LHFHTAYTEPLKAIGTFLAKKGKSTCCTRLAPQVRNLCAAPWLREAVPNFPHFIKLSAFRATTGSHCYTAEGVASYPSNLPYVRTSTCCPADPRLYLPYSCKTRRLMVSFRPGRMEDLSCLPRILQDVQHPQVSLIPSLANVQALHTMVLLTNPLIGKMVCLLSAPAYSATRTKRQYLQRSSLHCAFGMRVH